MGVARSARVRSLPAPEQLEGLEAGARTDIFALGCVLYEMATGRRAFQGATKTSLIAAIVSPRPEPIWSVVAMTPPALDHVVRKCLEKDPDDRWQSAHDVASELRWISEAGSQAAVAAPFAKKDRRRAWVGWLVAAAIASAWAVAVLTRKPAAQSRVETAIVAPDGVFLDSEGGGIALSPDGRRLAFVAHRAGETRRLWMRDLGSSSLRVLAGTEGATLPFWSPDGKAIAFFASGRLLRVSLDGGSPELVAGQVLETGGAWGPDGSILYASGTTGTALFRVPALGGATRAALCGSREPERSHSVTRLASFRRVVLTKDLPDEGLKAGDVGVVVEHYAGQTDMPDGYELEFFSATGETLAVVSVPTRSLREATGDDVLGVCRLARG